VTRRTGCEGSRTGQQVKHLTGMKKGCSTVTFLCTRTSRIHGMPHAHSSVGMCDALSCLPPL
jgi:hypothetical protein